MRLFECFVCVLLKHHTFLRRIQGLVVICSCVSQNWLLVHQSVRLTSVKMTAFCERSQAVRVTVGEIKFVISVVHNDDPIIRSFR